MCALFKSFEIKDWLYSIQILSISIIPIAVSIITYRLQLRSQRNLFERQNEQQIKLLNEKWMNNLRVAFSDFLEKVEMIRLEGSSPAQLEFSPKLRAEALKNLIMIKVLMNGEKDDEKKIVTISEEILAIADGNKDWKNYKSKEDELILAIQTKLKSLWHKIKSE